MLDAAAIWMAEVNHIKIPSNVMFKSRYSVHLIFFYKPVVHRGITQSTVTSLQGQ